MSGTSHREAARLEREIEAALDPGRYVSDGACFAFVGDLEEVATEVARLVPAAPSVAVALYEAFLAGCYEKADEVDDSSGGFGEFVSTLVSGWITARQAAGAAADGTAARLLGWMDEDPYGFCYRLDKDAVTVLDKAGLATMTDQVRARLDAPEPAEPVPGERVRNNHGYARRRWAGVLRTLYAAQNDVDAYIEFAEQSGLTADDCHTVAKMQAARRKPERALSWVERGIELDANTPHGSFAAHSLAELKPRLLAQLGREHEALETVWAGYHQHPSRYSYDELMTFAPETERHTWHEKAIDTAMSGTYLPSVIDLLLHTNETERLAELIRRSADTALETVSHSAAEPAAAILETTHPGEAARLWRAQGMRILAAKNSKHYDAALHNFERAKQGYEAAGLAIPPNRRDFPMGMMLRPRGRARAPRAELGRPAPARTPARRGRRGSRVKGAPPQAAVARSAMRSTLEAGGAAP
jgi:tetratricopeptide (TPR) repeat protein